MGVADGVDVTLIEAFASTLDVPPHGPTAVELPGERHHACRSRAFLAPVRHTLHHRDCDVEGHGVERIDERCAAHGGLVPPVDVSLTGQ